MKMRKVLPLLIIALMMPAFVQAQDLMAREAKADFQLKSSDVAKIITQFKVQEEVTFAKNIYGNHWDNDGVNVYKDMPKPEELVINLKDFSMPIKNRIVTSNYGYRPRFRRIHYGLDIDGCTGDTIFAAFSGKVRVRKYDARGFGYYIVIRHDNGLETVYGHLSKQLVNINQEVKSGEPIGLCGNTGHSFGSHLHFETRVLGEPINPAFMFDIAAGDVVSDTYTYRSKGGGKTTTLAVAEPVLSQAVSQDAQSQLVVTVANSHSKTKPKARIHKVQKGESLYTIARKNHTTVAEICKRNRIKENSTLRPGQVLTLK